MIQKKVLHVTMAYGILLSFPFGEMQLWDVIIAFIMYLVL